MLSTVRCQRSGSSFADLLTPEEADAIHAYVVGRALHDPGLLEDLLGWVAARVCIPATWIAD